MSKSLLGFQSFEVEVEGKGEEKEETGDEDNPLTMTKKNREEN